MLHGSNRTGVTLVEKWKDYAKKEGIILAGPDAQNLRGWGSPQDGPDFLRDLVEELKSEVPDQSASRLSVRSFGGRFVCASDVFDGVTVFCRHRDSRRRARRRRSWN